MEIFETDDYKLFVRSKVASFPKKGHGLFRQLGIHIGLNSVVISQIFKGHRDLTLEQALDVCEFFSLSQLEQDYFLLLVQYARAGNHKLKKVFLGKLKELQVKSRNLKERVSTTEAISLEAKSVYYSHWIYSGIRMASSLHGGQTIEAIADKLEISKAEAVRALEFLLENGICQRVDNKVQSGMAITHLESTSPLVSSHHRNWRIKGMEKMNSLDEDHFYFSMPLSLSVSDIKAIRRKLLVLVSELKEIVDPSPEEEIACLNIDWFKFGKRP